MVHTVPHCEPESWKDMQKLPLHEKQKWIKAANGEMNLLKDLLKVKPYRGACRKTRHWMQMSLQNQVWLRRQGISLQGKTGCDAIIAEIRRRLRCYLCSSSKAKYLQNVASSGGCPKDESTTLRRLNSFLKRQDWRRLVHIAAWRICVRRWRTSCL